MLTISSVIELEILRVRGNCGRTIADGRYLVLSKKEVCQIPDPNSIVIASRRVDLPVLKPAGGRGKHGTFVGNPTTNLLETRVEFLATSAQHKSWIVIVRDTLTVPVESPQIATP